MSIQQTPATLLIAEAEEAADVLSLFRSGDEGLLLRSLAAHITKTEAALDAIAARVNQDAFDSPSSALESIGDTLETTGRKVWTE